MKMMWALALSMLTPAAWAAAALQVEQVDGKVLVRATTAKLAAWRPEADALVVVIPASSGSVEVGALPTGMTAEKITQNGMAGVVVQGASGSWQVVQDGANWLIRPGAGLKAESVMMLRDGWRVGGETVKPQTFSAMGKQWQVGMVSSARSVAGSVAGAVKLGGAGVMAALPVEPVKSVSKIEISRTEVIKTDVAKVVSRTLVSQAEVKVPAIAAVAALQPAVAMEPAGKNLVSVEATAPLKPLGQPMMAASMLPVRSAVAMNAGRAAAMQAVSLSQMLARIEPASGPEPLTARALPLQAAMVVPSPTNTPAVGLTKVAVQPAPSMRPLGMGKVVEDLLPQILGDIYLPGTVVSLTVPDNKGQGTKAEGHPATVEEMVARSEVSVTTQPDDHAVAPDAAATADNGTWNQTTLAPVAAELALKAATPTVVTPMADVTVEETAEDVQAGKAPEISRILPQKEGIYQDELSFALQAIAETPEKSAREHDAQLNLAAFFLSWQRPEEAMAVLSELPKRSDGAPASPQARLYMGVAQLARGGTPTGGMLDQGGQLGVHGKLWQAVAASRDGDYATALKLWPQERGIMPQYPSYLREMAQQAQATALVMVGDRKVATEVIDQLIKGYTDPEAVPVGLMRLAGLARLGTPDENVGLEYLGKAAEDMRDPIEAYRAKYEFVRALQQRRDLSDEQVMKYLTDLWFDWRGDDLERDVLNSLADLQDKAGEPRLALQYWQTLVRAYPKSPDLGRVTERMTDAFLRVFDPENPKIYDSVAYIGLYYDFSELVPNDGRGDLVQEQIARMLVDANLWKRAVPILEQQLEHRPLDASTQGRLALMLAEAYGDMGRAADGIKLLDKWQNVAKTTVLSRNWKLQEAKLMLLLNRPDAATAAVASLPLEDREALRLKVEAAWEAQNWRGSVPLLQAQLANTPAVQLISDTGAQLATFRLGYAYGQLREGPQLDALSKRFESGLAKLPQLSDDVGAVAAGTGVSASVVAVGPLAPLTTALNDLNRMTEKVERVRSDITSEREKQKEYNDKMRYMDLLPPPAI